jgi:hypothetical protein
MGTREDLLIMIDELEELKDFAREQINRVPEREKFRGLLSYRRIWRKLRRYEDKILKEAYTRNITLKFGNDLKKFREVFDTAPDYQGTWKNYLDGRFVDFWGNALEEFILLHTKWNEIMNIIIHDEFY